MKPLKDKARIALLLGIDTASPPLLRLLRGVIVIRLVAPEDFSVSLVFGLTTMLVDSLSNLGAERLLIQDRDGGRRRFARCVQSFLLARGLITGAIIFLAAPYIGWWFQIEHATWALRCLALVPLMRGLENCDLWRLQRDLRYAPKATVSLTANLVVLAAAVPVALITRDYRVFLVNTLLAACIRLPLSHLVAERPFGLSWDRAVIVKIFNFGWPLAMTAVFTFLTTQGDRLVIGRVFSPEWLAWYGAAANLATVSGSVLAAALGQLALPVLSKQRDYRATLERTFAELHLGGVTLAALIGVALFVGGPTIATLLYGGDFAPAGPLLQGLGVSQCLALMRVVSDQAMIAAGDTKSPSLVNCCRATSLVGLIWATSQGFGIEAAVALAVVAEGAALVLSHGLLIRGHGFSAATVALNATPGLAAFAVVGFAAIGGRLESTTTSLVDLLLVAALASGSALAAAFAIRRWSATASHVDSGEENPAPSVGLSG